MVSRTESSNGTRERICPVLGGLLITLLGSAQAVGHQDPCHSQHSCPSDHRTYAWTQPAVGISWWCVEPGAPEQGPFDRTTMVSGARTYLCYWAGGAPPPDPGPFAAAQDPGAGLRPQITSIVEGDRRPTISFALPDGWTPKNVEISVDLGPVSGYAPQGSVVGFSPLGLGQVTWTGAAELPPGINYYARATAEPPPTQCVLGICLPVFSAVVGFRTTAPALPPPPAPIVTAPTSATVPAQPVPVVPVVQATTGAKSVPAARFQIQFDGASIEDLGTVVPGMTLARAQEIWGRPPFKEPEFNLIGYRSGAYLRYSRNGRIAEIGVSHRRWVGPEDVRVGMTTDAVERKLGPRLRWVPNKTQFAGRGVARQQPYLLQGRLGIGLALSRGRVVELLLTPTSRIRATMAYYGPL